MYHNGRKELTIISNPAAILKAYPAALITGNDVGGTPLHLASCGENASAEIVLALLEKHDALEYPIGSIDVSGNAAIHIAIKTKAPVKVLQAFKNVFGDEPFYKFDADDRSGLQIALTMKNVDPNIVFFLSYSAPLTGKSSLPKTGGIMPAVYAAQNDMPDYVVKQLLLCDMPIQFLPQNRRDLAPVILRTHKFSWWIIATKFPKYASVLDDILKNHANLHETVVLAQETDPEGFGCLYENAVGHVKIAFKNNLVFGERYEVIAMFRAIVRDNLLKVCALDWGDRIAWEEISESEKCVEMKGDAYATTRAQSDDENEIEVEYNTYTKPQREVVLHCCVKDSDAYYDLMEELDARKKFNFDRAMCQRLFNVHSFDAKKIGCVGEMLCLSFERPLLTLQDVSSSWVVPTIKMKSALTIQDGITFFICSQTPSPPSKLKHLIQNSNAIYKRYLTPLDSAEERTKHGHERAGTSSNAWLKYWNTFILQDSSTAMSNLTQLRNS